VVPTQGEDSIELRESATYAMSQEATEARASEPFVGLLYSRPVQISRSVGRGVEKMEVSTQPAT
jgi:hypothetical protein